jgi:hypothetical protein
MLAKLLRDLFPSYSAQRYFTPILLHTLPFTGAFPRHFFLPYTARRCNAVTPRRPSSTLPLTLALPRHLFLPYSGHNAVLLFFCLPYPSFTHFRDTSSCYPLFIDILHSCAPNASLPAIFYPSLSTIPFTHAFPDISSCYTLCIDTALPSFCLPYLSLVHSQNVPSCQTLRIDTALPSFCLPYLSLVHSQNIPSCQTLHIDTALPSFCLPYLSLVHSQNVPSVKLCA